MTSKSTGTSSFKTTCCYCGVGCGMDVHKDSKGIIQVEGDKSYPVNRGMLCSKGMNLHHTVHDHSERLLYPQMRYNRSMPLQRVSWDQALERTAAVFKTFISKYGPNSVAFYVSGQCLTEEYYLVNKLVKGFIGTNNIDTNSRLCMSSAVAAYKMSLGEDSVPVCYDDIELSDCLLVTGANPAWCHPIIWRRVEAHKASNPEVKIIVVDPRRTDSCAIADLHLQINPGTDITLNNAIGRILIEDDKIDHAFIRDHAEGFEKYKSVVLSRTVEEAARICGVTVADIRLAATFIGQANGFISMWTMGLNQSAMGVDKNLSLINLNLITGHIGKPGSGPLSLTGQPNAMGGRETGGLANMLPAHRSLDNPEHRQFIETFWGGGSISRTPGLTATEMFEQLEKGQLKAIWIICTNPLVSLPNVRAAENALKNAKFVVVQEMSSKPETLQYADVILPAASWLEKEGTMTNSERRISYLPKVLDAPGEALPDADIILRFARKMNFDGFDFENIAAVYDEYVKITEGTNISVAGLSHQKIIQNRSVQWPYAEYLNTPSTRLFEDRNFHTASSRAKIHAVVEKHAAEPVSREYPLILTTGRIRDQWHTMSRTGKVNKLNLHTRQACLEMHPTDAKKLQVESGDLVMIRSRQGEVRVPAAVSISIKPGVVFLPMHWGKISGNDLNRTNNVTSTRVDPVSKEPDFKFTAVSVERYKKPKQHIVVIGAGAGAFGFVRSYRKLNPDDQVTIFSKENFPFYNRVMLPDYISGVQSWEQLIKMKDEEEPGYNIRLLRGTSIESVNREEKYVIDSNGCKTNYDILIMATGSRAAIPPNVPKLPGIFTMRSRTDADEFIRHVPSNGHVVIVGGGLLGLELAASLRESGIAITIIQRISRFLDRQLDLVGSQMLHDEMIEQGCTIYYNDEVQQYYGKEQLTAVRLKSGHYIECDALVLAIGTVPNIELARASGLQCQRGVIVNERLQSSDPNIFAIGEIAEVSGMLYGITAAAEEQAEIVARYLAGDISVQYKGSLLMNIIKIHGFDLCSLGIPDCPNDTEYEEIIFIDKAKRYYKKCIIHFDRLVGAILIGDKAEFQEFKELISGKIELSDKRLQLLRSGRKAEPVIGQLICSCNNVGAGNIVNKISEGHSTLQSLCSATGAGMGCGSCRPEVEKLLHDAQSPLLILPAERQQII